MINPVGSDKLLPLFVSDETKRNALLEEARELPAVEISSAAAANAVMFGGGYFTPLKGYMNLVDALGVAVALAVGIPSWAFSMAFQKLHKGVGCGGFPSAGCWVGLVRNNGGSGNGGDNGKFGVN